jgi:hypothetical protein
MQAPSDFRTPLRAVAGTLAHLFGPTSAGCTAKGGVSTSTTCSVAVIEVSQPKLLSLDFNLQFCSLRLIYARMFGVLVKTLYDPVCYRTKTYMLCAFGQCGVLGFPYRTSTSRPRTKVACGVRGHAERSETINENFNRPPIGNHLGMVERLHQRPGDHLVRTYANHREPDSR